MIPPSNLSKKDSPSVGSKKKGHCYMVVARSVWSEIDGT